MKLGKGYYKVQTDRYYKDYKQLLGEWNGQQLLFEEIYAQFSPKKRA
jgi:hypothetical protein